MATDGNRSIELQVTNNTSEDFVVIDAFVTSNNAKWMSGEAPVVGKSFPHGTSVTWGVVAIDSSSSAGAEVRLTSSKKSAIGFEFQNLVDGICTMEVQLSPNVQYTVGSIAAVNQLQTKSQVTVIPS